MSRVKVFQTFCEVHTTTCRVNVMFDVNVYKFSKSQFIRKKLSKQAAMQLLAFVCVSCCASIHYTCLLGGDFNLMVNESVRIVKLSAQHLYHKHGFLSM